MISGCYSQISSTSDVPFDEISNSKLKGISWNNNEGRGPITRSTVFHSLKAMQDVHLCMYVCMRVCTVYICFTKWLSTDVFHSWSLRYAFDPATTSSVVYGVYGGTEWGPQIRLCVSVRPSSNVLTSHSMAHQIVILTPDDAEHSTWITWIKMLGFTK